MTDLGLMFPAPAVIKADRLSPRVSESSDASTCDSSQSGFQVSNIFILFYVLKFITFYAVILRSLRKQMMFVFYWRCSHQFL